MRFIVAACFALFVAAPSWAQLSWRIPTPWGDWTGSVDPVQIALNPLSVLNPTGIPTTGDFLEVVARDPDNLLNLITRPQDAPYYAVASAMSAARNAVLVKGGNRIPAHVRTALAAWYPAELLDSIRWSTDWNALQNTAQAIQFIGAPDIQAITFINVVIFRDPKSVDDIGLWAHEVYHAQQYSEWGLLEFARQWVNNSSLGGPVEGPAYDQQRLVEAAIQRAGGPLNVPMPTHAQCYEKNKSFAYCDLYAAYGSVPARFQIDGDAYATGAGTNSGRMRLIMVANQATCNSGAYSDYSIDNATRLTGREFRCMIDVAAGTSTRITLSAPNNRADATYTRAIATLIPTPSRTEAICQSTSASTAECELKVATDIRDATFTVSGDAYATSDGSRKGQMQLNLSVNGANCNARAGQNVGVDNATNLKGDGYTCTIVVPGGASRTVYINAPNSIATATYTRGSATFVPGPPQ